MATYFNDIAPTLAKRSKLNIGMPLGGVSARDAIAVPSDPRFDARAGSAPVESAAAGIQYGGAQDGRVEPQVAGEAGSHGGFLGKDF